MLIKKILIIWSNHRKLESTGAIFRWLYGRGWLRVYTRIGTL